MTIQQKYKEWNNSARCKETLHVGALHRGHTVSIFDLPCGTELYDHWVSPMNPFEKAHGWVVIYYPVLNNEHNAELIKRFNGELDDQHYLDESLALLRFDKTDNAWYGFYINKDSFQLQSI